jgi:hypothetical protein
MLPSSIFVLIELTCLFNLKPKSIRCQEMRRSARGIESLVFDDNSPLHLSGMMVGKVDRMECGMGFVMV